MADLITVDLDTTGDTITIRTAGELDLSTVTRLRDALDEAAAAKPASIILDLAQVRFMSVCALHPIEATARTVRAETGGELILGERSRAVERVLMHVPIDPSVQVTSAPRPRPRDPSD